MPGSYKFCVKVNPTLTNDQNGDTRKILTLTLNGTAGNTKVTNQTLVSHFSPTRNEGAQVVDYICFWTFGLLGGYCVLCGLVNTVVFVEDFYKDV